MPNLETTLRAKILVVDDEAGIRYFLQETLTEDGHQVQAVASGEEALERLAREEFDLALLDLKMKGIGGLEVLSALRKHSPSTVAIVMTGYASLETAVEALRQGAHDYLYKPCETAALRASIQAGLQKRQQQLRQQETLAQVERNLQTTLDKIRGTAPSAPAAAPGEAAKGMVVDSVRQTAQVDGHPLELSPTEFDLLAYLAAQAPRVVSPQELVARVKGCESDGWEAREMLRSHMSNLRRKIQTATGRTDVIRTVRGKGYAIEIS